HLLASLSSLLFPVQSMISTDLNLFHKNETSQFHLLVDHLVNKADSHNGPNVHDLKIQHPPYECLGHINMDEQSVDIPYHFFHYQEMIALPQYQQNKQLSGKAFQ